MFRRFVTVTAIYLAAAAPAVVSGAAFQLVALTGQAAPGTDPEVQFSSFQSIGMNDQGAVVFQAGLRGAVNSSNSAGIWIGTPGDLKLVARRGAPAPGTEGRTFATFAGNAGPVVISQTGDTAFRADLGAGTYAEGVWVGHSGNIQLVARTDDIAPGANAPFQYLRDPLLGQNSFVAFRADLQTPGVNTSGIWAGSPGALELVALRRTQAPGAPPGVLFGQLDVGGLQLNRAGRLAFSAYLEDPQFTSGIWSGKPQALELAALPGMVAPGVAGEFAGLGSPSMNESGTLGFLGSVKGVGINDSNETGIWLGTAGNLRLIAREGAHAPGFSEAFTYADEEVFLGRSNAIGFPTLTDSGKVIFEGNVAGPAVDELNNQAIWAGDPENLVLIAREGAAAPGTPSGTLFGGERTLHGSVSYAFASHILNANGLVAFSAHLSGQGVNLSNDWGIWAGDLSGNLSLLLRDGDLLDVGGGDLRQVAGVNFCGDFSDNGSLPLSVRFTDGSSGIFIVQIPEPGLMVFGISCVLGVGRRLRRHFQC